MYHNFFIHSSVYGHLGCFHVLAIVNSAAINNGIHVSFSPTIIVLLSISPFTSVSVCLMYWGGPVLGASVQFSSVAQLCLTLCNPMITAWQASLPVTSSQSLPKLMSIELLTPSNHLILCHPLLLLPSIFPSIWIFSNESARWIRWPKYWSFSFNISHSNEYSGLISFRIDWFDRLAVQGTPKSLLQHHSSKPSILRCSAFFIVQLTSIHDHWKNHSFD